MKITNSNAMWDLLKLELFLIVIIGILIFSVVGRKKKGTYSWEKQKGANSVAVVLATVLLIAFSIYLGFYLYDRNVISFNF